MNDRSRVLKELRHLKSQHQATLGDTGDAPGFIQDEQVTRKSYSMVAEDALEAGVVTKEDLQNEDLPVSLEQKEGPTD